MSRTLPAALQTEIDKPVVRPFLALRVELPDPVYLFTGRGTITFNDSDGISRDWLGAGELGALEPVSEATDGTATGIRAALYKIPSEFADYVSNQPARGVKVEIYLGALNETFQQVEATVLLNRYKLDQYKIIDNGDSLTVEIVGESRAIDARRPAIKRFTDEYQQRKHPGDKFFEYLPRMTEIAILWAQADQGGGGTMPVGGAAGAGGGGGGGFLINSIRPS